MKGFEYLAVATGQSILRYQRFSKIKEIILD